SVYASARGFPLHTRSIVTGSGGGVPSSSITLPERKIGRCCISGKRFVLLLGLFGSGNGLRGVFPRPPPGTGVAPGSVLPGAVGGAPPPPFWAAAEKTRPATPIASERIVRIRASRLITDGTSLVPLILARYTVTKHIMKSLYMLTILALTMV